MTKLFVQSGKVLGLLLLAASAAFSAVVDISVIASVGPTADSPSGIPASWTTYVDNAEYALQNNLTSYGTPNTPGYYTQATTPFYSGGLITTTFNSWMGSAPGLYAGQYGNELYFGLSLYSTTAFSMSQVGWFSDFVSLSPANLSPLTFNLHTVGISGGTGTNCSGGTLYNGVANSGTSSTLVNCLWYSGVTGFDLVSDPADLSGALSDLTGTGYGGYTLGDSSGQANVDAEIPEPGTVALLSLGFGAILCLRKKVFATRIG
jgi:hypothetical protein